MSLEHYNAVAMTAAMLASGDLGIGEVRKEVHDGIIKKFGSYPNMIDRASSELVERIDAPSVSQNVSEVVQQMTQQAKTFKPTELIEDTNRLFDKAIPIIGEAPAQLENLFSMINQRLA